MNARVVTLRSFASLAALAAATSWLASCEPSSDGGSNGSGGANDPVVKTKDPAAPGVNVVIAYGSEKKTWLEEQVKLFAATSPKTKAGNPITITAKAMGSGDAATSILNGTVKATVFSPASSAYVQILNQQWLSQPGHTKPLVPAGDPVLLSPIVIGMWKPMAEALGWPKKQLSWDDLIKINANKKGWGAYGHPEWGAFKLGHTHPLFSNSGLQSIVAEAYAGAKKTRGLTAADLDDKKVTSLMEDVENDIVHYGKSTGFFSDQMLARGPAYLSAAVLYENLIVEAASKPQTAPFPLVAIYPVEGTFWSDHPYAIVDADWVKPAEREGAEQFLTFLKGKAAQTRALQLGFRPADPSIAIGSPIDEAHFVDAKQPQTLLETPDGATLQKLLDVWARIKKPANVVLVFDKSGSMSGQPILEAKAGAKAFLDILHERDEVALLFFDGIVNEPIGPFPLKDGKAKLQKAIDDTFASGGTSLYDAVAKAYATAAEKAKTEKGRIQAVVVMTDGADSGSRLPLDELKKKFGTNEDENSIHVFTIAFGEQAEEPILKDIAKAAGGAEAKGKVDDIVGVFRDMASFF